MKINAYTKVDDYGSLDLIEVWLWSWYIQLIFYPVYCWCWEWAVYTVPSHPKAIRFEFPSFSVYIAKRY